MIRTFQAFAFPVLLSVLGMVGCEKVTGPEVDTEPPRIAETAPEDGAINVPAIPAMFGASFSEPVQEQSIVFSLTRDGNPVPGFEKFFKGSLRIGGFSFRIDLAYGATFVATIESGLADTVGNVMLQDYSWSFTTEDQHAKSLPLRLHQLVERADEQDTSANKAEGGVR